MSRYILLVLVGYAFASSECVPIDETKVDFDCGEVWGRSFGEYIPEHTSNDYDSDSDDDGDFHFLEPWLEINLEDD